MYYNHKNNSTIIITLFIIGILMFTVVGDVWEEMKWNEPERQPPVQSYRVPTDFL